MGVEQIFLRLLRGSTDLDLVLMLIANEEWKRNIGLFVSEDSDPEQPKLPQ